MERTHRQPVFLEGTMDFIIIIIIIKTDTNNVYFTLRPIYTYDHTSLSFS